MKNVMTCKSPLSYAALTAFIQLMLTGKFHYFKSLSPTSERLGRCLLLRLDVVLYVVWRF